MKQQSVRLAATGARVAAGAIIATACVLGVAGAVAAPWPQVTTQPATTRITPVPGDTVLVCDGSFRALGRDSTQAGLMASAGVPRRLTSGEIQASDLAMPDAAGGSGAAALTAPVEGRRAPVIAASESLRLADDDLTGFAASACREPSLSSWIVGGDVSTGASGVIVLTNPGAVTANVTLNVYGDKRGASTVVVPARTQLGVPLASVASGQGSPVIEVVSAGAPVRATLQSSLVRTLDAVGIDVQDGVSGLQTEQIILGAHSTQPAQGDDSTGLIVRMLSPDTPTTATVQVRAAGDTTVLDEFSIDLVAQTPVDIALAELPPGVYDIQVRSEIPIVAGARQSVHIGNQEDFSWALPSPQLAAETEVAFAVPDGAPTTLSLYNAEDEQIAVTLSGAQEQTVTVGAGSSTQVAVSRGGYTLQSSGRLHAALGMLLTDDAALIASWPLTPGGATQQPIIVRP